MQDVMSRVLAFWLLFAALGGAVCANEVQDAQALTDECSNAGSQTAMHECIARSAAKSVAELDKAEKTLRQALAKWDEDPPYISEATSKLDAANKEFVRYRKSQCDFAASLAGGAAGNPRRNAILACEFELNSRRAAYFRSVASRLSSK